MNKNNIIDRKTLDEHIENIINKVNAEQEYLCAAFLKYTGLSPEECTICYQTKDGVSRIWIERLTTATIKRKNNE